MNNDKPVSEDIARMPDEAALPRKNGELVFNAPWQGRAFGMAVSLHNDQRYDWQEFQQRLIQRVSRVDEYDGGNRATQTKSPRATTNSGSARSNSCCSTRR